MKWLQGMQLLGSVVTKNYRVLLAIVSIKEKRAVHMADDETRLRQSRFSAVCSFLSVSRYLP